jgi:predicted RNA-binding Zn ribbon-like protein
MPTADFIWLADHPALDFLNTTYQHKGEQVETLASGEALAQWLVDSHLVDAQDAQALRRVLPRGGASHALLRDACELREWFRSFIAVRAGAPLAMHSAAGLRRLNEVLAKSETHSRLDLAPLEQAQDAEAAAGNGLRLRRVRHWSAPSQLLHPIAEAMAELVCQADFRMVRSCEAPDCTLCFLDRTKSHRRRWCSMALCGNRMKVAAFRARQ